MTIFPTFRGVSKDLELLQMHLVDRGPTIPGVPFGRLMSGAPFYMNEFEAQRLGYVTGVGMLITGKVGKRKSTGLKCDICRKKLVRRGNRRWRTLVFDYKEEYGGVAAFYGTELIRYADPEVRRKYCLNILDLRLFNREQRIALFENLMLASSDIPVSALENEALITALEHVDREAVDRNIDPLLPRLEHWLRNPTEEDALALGLKDENGKGDARKLYEQGHRLAAEILMVMKSLPGVLDQPTSEELNFERQFTGFSFKGLPERQKRILIAMIGGAVEFGLENGNPRFEVDTIVYEEVWEYFRYLGFGRMARKSQKLHRQAGHHNVFVMHRVSDMAGAGADGSEAVKLALGLVADVAFHVTYFTDAGEIPAIAQLLNLNETQQHIISKAPAGTSLWTFGEESLVVAHQPTPFELPLTYTDKNMHRDETSGLFLPQAA